MDILFRSTRQHLLTVHIHPEAINIRPEILFFWINLYDLAKKYGFCAGEQETSTNQKFGDGF